VLIGGGGERKTLRLVAQYADACNLFSLGTDEVRRKLEVLDRHCAEVGRDPASIQRTVMGADPVADPDAFLAQMEEYAGLGITHVQVMPAGPDPVGWVGTVVERVLPRLRDLG
jgi:alkanesulfonate monooxygenase SsuD/methylene tetrahydromethanopterin reductase-like flavin-dependent oxidoreductase (luciferase family)